MNPTFETQPRFFYVGKDAQGIKDLHYGELYKEHLVQIPIKYQDIDNSWNLIFALNDELSLLIDIDESEVIVSEKLQKALEIAERVIAKESDPTKIESMSVFLSAIKTAISYHSPLLIWW